MRKSFSDYNLLGFLHFTSFPKKNLVPGVPAAITVRWIISRKMIISPFLTIVASIFKCMDLKSFNKLDLQRAYLHIPVRMTSLRPQLALRLVFLSISLVWKMPERLFKVIDWILVITKKCFSYLDDILVASETIKEIITQVEQVLSLLADHNLRLSLDKCVFFQSSLTSLGYDISANSANIV